MTQPTSNPLPPATPAPMLDRARATSMLDALRAILAAIPADAVVRPRVSWEVVLDLTGVTVRQFRDNIKAKGDLSDEGWQRVQSALDTVDAAAIAYFAAQEIIEAAQPSDRIARRRALQKKARAHDAYFSKWGRPAFEDDAVEGPIVALIVPGNGTADDAQDTVAWVAMWRRHPDVMAKSPITAAYLDEAEADATELLPLLAADEKDSDARELARRAYTHWAGLYNHIVKTGRFLGAEALEWTGISSPRSPSTTKDDDSKGTTTTPTTTTTTTTPVTSAVPA